MSRTLRTPLRQRVRDLQLRLGPLGAGVTLDLDSRAEDVISLVPEVERAIGNQFGITYFTDPDLQVGQWFTISETPMLYDTSTRRPGGVLFIGEDESRFLLGGSAEYLLDRQLPDKVKSSAHTFSPSTLAGIMALLYVVFRYDYAEDDIQDISTTDPSAYEGQVHERISELFRVLPYANLEPMSALARCLEIDTTQDGKRTIIGTPLYVAFQAPK